MKLPPGLAHKQRLNLAQQSRVIRAFLEQEVIAFGVFQFAGCVEKMLQPGPTRRRIGRRHKPNNDFTLTDCREPGFSDAMGMSGTGLRFVCLLPGNPMSCLPLIILSDGRGLRERALAAVYASESLPSS